MIRPEPSKSWLDLPAARGTMSALILAVGNQWCSNGNDDDQDDHDHTAHLLPHLLLVLVGCPQLLDRLASIVDRLRDSVLDLVKQLALE